MRKLILLSAVLALLAGCGGSSDDPPSASTPTPAATEEETHDLEGYSQGVKDYYGGAHEHAEGDVEAEYHQPPKPAEAGLGETITLTGTNIGVRFDVTVTEVEPASDDLMAVSLKMLSTGITIYDSPLDHATVTYPGGEPVGVAAGESAECSNGFDEPLRIEVGDEISGCLLFPTSGDDLPERFQLALEVVPVEAGGIWNLSSG
jgi:hypothetical protein